MAERVLVNSTGTQRQNIGAGFYISAAVVFAISLAVTVYLFYSMAGGMDMPGGWAMSMIWMRMPGQPWLAAAAMFLLMWLAMMVAMMLPSALPMLRRYRAAQHHLGSRWVGGRTLVVAAGYFFVWLVIGVPVYAVGALLALAAMKYPGLSHTMPLLCAALLIVCGGMQFTPLKLHALQRCRGQEACEAIETSGKYRAAWRHGLGLGMSCAMCSSGLMLILLILGIMNLIVMVIVAAVIALERLMPKPELIVWGSGIVAICAGLSMMVYLS